MFPEPAVRRVLVLGGYGLVGSACVRALKDAGFQVSGLGRSAEAGHRSAPDIDWIAADVARTTAEEWREILAPFCVIVNASGILQDGNGDSLESIHIGAIARMTQAVRDQRPKFIQISAVGACQDADTAFLSTKARGDAILAASDLTWTILRPGLVLAPQAFGGSALLRAAAAFAYVEPRMFETARIQTVFIDDVANAVVLAAKGEVLARKCYDLVEPEGRTLPEVVAKIRAWQGHAVRRIPLRTPRWALTLAGRGADALGLLGWRSGLRTTALRVLERGVVGNPAPWAEASGTPCRDLDATLARLPSTVQERWFANAFFLVPAALACLSLFWVLSGLVALLRPEAAASVLTTRGVPGSLAFAAVFAGAAIDIALGAGVLVRRYAKAALLGMVAASVIYLVGATVLAPDLWADPLGPLVKVLPGIVLALFARALLDPR